MLLLFVYWSSVIVAQFVYVYFKILFPYAIAYDVHVVHLPRRRTVGRKGRERAINQGSLVV